MPQPSMDQPPNSAREGSSAQHRPGPGIARYSPGGQQHVMRNRAGSSGNAGVATGSGTSVQVRPRAYTGASSDHSPTVGRANVGVNVYTRRGAPASVHDERTNYSYPHDDVKRTSGNYPQQNSNRSALDRTGDASYQHGSSSADSPSRRSGLFSSLRRRHKSPGKSGGHNASDGPDSPGTYRRGSGEPNLPGEQPMDVDPFDDSSPKGSLGRGFWETFRPRSKSDTKSVWQARQMLRSGDDGGVRRRPANATGDMNESGDHLYGESPLYVDTGLANRKSGSGGAISDQGSTTGQYPSAKTRSSLSHVMDRILASHGRQRSYSSSFSQREDGSYRRSSDENAALAPKLRNPSASGSGDYLVPGSQLKLMPQHSLDSFLGYPPPGPGGMPTAIIYKTESQQFFIGNDPTALAVSSLENENLVYGEFMRIHKCYDLIPTSSKLVVFDTQLLLKKAFFALVYNGVRAAPLWDTKLSRFVGMLTITDFINILLRHHNNDEKSNLEEDKIVAWKAPGADSGPKFYAIDVNESLFTAVKTLCEKRVHRLPVIDAQTGNVLYILTHKRILKFLHLYMTDLPKPRWVEKPPRELGIGQWKNIIKVHPNTPLIDALSIFSKNRVSALPVVEEATGVVVDVYSRFDVIHIAAEKSYNDLSITITEALKSRQDWFEGVIQSSETDSLWTVIQTLVEREVHRVVMTDESKQVKGMVSLSDVLSFLILKPAFDLDYFAPIEASSGIAKPVTVTTVDECQPMELA